MFKTTILCFALLFFSVGAAMADGITYDVTVDTSSIAGTAGSLDLQFNPGPYATQSADLEIDSFASDGILGTAVLTGDASGSLPGTVSFDNGSGYNDYFTTFTYGDTISFLVNVSGLAIDAPDGVSTSGSTFAFSMFSDAEGTIPVLTTDSVNGFAFTENINLDGTVSTTAASSELAATTVNPVATPEAGTLPLLCCGFGALALSYKRRKLV